ncbi:3'-5' exoribonuclease [Pseudomonas viridiflava]|nr:3'-5' exoribonuclease [Pseudomonas syringae]ALE00377.1 hypothetical protein PSYRMG_09745 [Pseudomonas syringae UMAF0158]MCI3911802.1 3'-5' exoribonuclease [Pseudomonas viridiflava]MCK9730326.1 3'-5' exoribonuclease [Pseudomonas syringae pv. syringae]
MKTTEERTKLFLDFEFTQLNRDTKLISLALVSEAGHEYYVELTDTYLVADCSDFVIQNVLPQLDMPAFGQPLAEAQVSLLAFLSNLEGPLEICSDAPDWDWDLFCKLAYVNHRWPASVANRQTNLILLFRHLEADDIGNVTLLELPHHALLDARVLADLYRRLIAGSNRGMEHG